MEKREEERKLFLVELGKRITALREEVGISQTELGYRCNYERSVINRIEMGRTNPTIFSLKRVADGLQIPLYKLFDASSYTESFSNSGDSE